jgi:protein-tyrosine-phosphatase
MEASHRRFLLDEFPASFRKVLTLGQFAEAAADTSSRGRLLVTELARQRPPVRSADDVADPYRRGREANARAAAQITALLEVALPALAEVT